MTYLFLIIVLVILVAILALARFTVFMVGASIYDVQQHFRRRDYSPCPLPTLSVVIPAYNEENTIAHSVSSVVNADYDREKLQIIVIDDGSKDSTASVVSEHIRRGTWPNVYLVAQTNAGKAHALNNALKNYATGEVIMCLDADSTIERDALLAAVRYFRDPKVIALVSNVRIRRNGSLLSLIQYYEYVISRQMKRALSVFNVEYIVGGLGSAFRKSALEAVGYYDTDTIVEDMDVTFKLLRLGNKKHRIVFGADVVCHTASVLTLRELLKQRYRWQYGHLQTLLKHADLFFSGDRKYAPQLTWGYLPFIVLSEFLLLIEPLIPALLLFLLYWFGDFISLFSGISVVTASTILHIVAETTIPWRERLMLAIGAPAMYFASYLLMAVAYISLLRTYANIGTIKSAKTSKWEPVERPQLA